jgi:PAS domain S-box-containing protein
VANVVYFEQLSILQTNYFSALLAFIPALINGGIIVYIQQKLPRNKVTDAFSWVVVALIIWQLEDAILRLPISLQMARLWDGVFCIGWLSIAPLLFHFACRFAQLEKLYCRTALLLANIPFVIFYILHMTNLPHSEFIHDKNWGWVNQLNGDISEKLRWFSIYLLTVASIAVLIRYAVQLEAGTVRKKQATVIATGILISGLLIAFIQVLLPMFFSTKQIHISSTCLSLFSIVTLLAVTKYKLFWVADSVKSFPLLEKLNEMVMVISPAKKIIYINPLASEVLGISRIYSEAIPLEKIFSSVEEDYKKYSKELFEKVMRGMSIDNFPCAFRTKNNETINVMISSTPVVNNEVHEGILLIASDITPMVTAIANLGMERMRKEKEIAEACLATQEEERKFIGGELHDNVNQILASSLLYLSMVKSKVQNPFIADVENLINSAIQEIRKLSHSLIAPSLNEAELTKAVDNIVEMTRKAGRFDIQHEAVQINEASLSDKLKLDVYRIIQEQLNNIIKYSKANLVRLNLSQESNKLCLKIIDDGVGFDTSSASSGRGIANMRNRAKLNNGKLNIISSPGKGCELSVVFENVAY